MGLSSYFCKKKNGGEEGIRTLDAGLPHTPLAGERLRPLGHLSTAVDRQGEQGFQVNLLDSYDFLGNHSQKIAEVILWAPNEFLEFFLEGAQIKLLRPSRAVLLVHHEERIGNSANLKRTVFAFAVEIFSP